LWKNYAEIRVFEEGVGERKLSPLNGDSVCHFI